MSILCLSLVTLLWFRWNTAEHSITVSADCKKEHFGNLKQNIFVTAHHRDLQTLTYEICKIKNDMAPEILTGIDKYFPIGKQL